REGRGGGRARLRGRTLGGDLGGLGLRLRREGLLRRERGLGAGGRHLPSAGERDEHGDRLRRGLGCRRRRGRVGRRLRMRDRGGRLHGLGCGGGAGRAALAALTLGAWPARGPCVAFAARGTSLALGTRAAGAILLGGRTRAARDRTGADGARGGRTVVAAVLTGALASLGRGGARATRDRARAGGARGGRAEVAAAGARGTAAF